MDFIATLWELFWTFFDPCKEDSEKDAMKKETSKT